MKTFRAVEVMRSLADGLDAGNAKTTLLKVMYTLSNGTVVTKDSSLSGNSIYVFASIPEVMQNTVSDVIVNNRFRIFYSETIKANGTAFAVKQRGIRMKLVDYLNDNVLLHDSLRFFINGIDSTNLVRFSNAQGHQIFSLTEALSDTAFYWTYINGASIIAGNTSRKYEIGGVARGFTNSNQGDIVRFTGLVDNKKTNIGSKIYFNAPISDRRIYVGGNEITSEVSNFVWSPVIGSFSAYPGEGVSSNNWHNSMPNDRQLLTELVGPIQHL
jgi:hypothetical protein